MTRTRALLIVAMLTAVAFLEARADQNIAVLRASSLEALEADFKRVAGDGEGSTARDALLLPLLKFFGMTDAGWVDGSRPLALAMTFNGVGLGAKGLLGVLPTGDPATTIETIGKEFDSVKIDEEGVHHLAREDGTAVVVMPRDGYIIVGMNELLVTGFDESEALGAGGFPPGNLTLDVLIEPVAPVILLGLQTGMHMLEQQMRQKEAAESGDAGSGEEGGEADISDPDQEIEAPGTTPEGNDAEAVGDEAAGTENDSGGADREASRAEQGQREANDEAGLEEDAGTPGEAPGPAASADETAPAAADPEATMAVIRLWFDFLQDMVKNISRLQLSIEVAAEDIIFHKRIFPKAASTLDGFLRAQEGEGLPDLARYVDPGGDLAVLAGSVTYTPALLEAIRVYGQRYLEVMRDLGEALPDPLGPDWYRASAEMMSRSIEQWTACYRGDFVQTFDIAPETGLAVEYVMGVGDPMVCRTVLTESAQILKEIYEGSDSDPLLMLTENAMEYRGVEAMRQEFNFALPEKTGGDAAVNAMLNNWFQGGKMVGYVGIVDDLLVSSTGPDAERTFKALVDRVSADDPGAGITPAEFAPLKVGPGLFAAIDMLGMFKSVAKGVPTASGAEPADPFAELPGNAGRVVWGVRLAADKLDAEIAVKLEMVESLMEAAARKAAQLQEGARCEEEGAVPQGEACCEEDGAGKQDEGSSKEDGAGKQDEGSSKEDGAGPGDDSADGES